MDESLIIGILFFALLACMFSMVYFIFPNSAAHLTSEIEDPRFKYAIVQCSYGLAIAWMAMSVCSMLALSTSALFIYYHLVLPIQAKEFRVGAAVRGQKALPDLRTVQHLPSVYRCMEYLTNFQNRVLSQSLIPVQTVVLYLVLFCNTMLIKHWNRLNFTLRVTFITITGAGCLGWIFVIKTLSLCSVWNKKTRASWKRNNWGKRADGLYMARFARSCKPMCVCFGKYYMVQPKSVLKFLRSVSRGTFRVLLLSLKNKR